MFSCQIREHLTIRLLAKEDTDELYSVMKRNQNHLSEWLSWAEELADIDTYRDVIIPEWRYKYAEENGFDAGIFVKGRFCGMISIHNVDTVNQKQRSATGWIESMKDSALSPQAAGRSSPMHFRTSG